MSREIDEEFEAHIAEAIAHGRDPAEARRAFGPVLRRREESRDFRLIPWLDSVRGDAVFAWRQIHKNRVASAAAVLSLGLGIGACTSAFRLIDALFLRPLPVDRPERLFALSSEAVNPADGKVFTNDACAYPMFQRMRALVKDQAELIAISYAARIDLTYAAGQQVEKAYQQYISGWMFSSFGVQPALSRVFTESDDVTPGAHRYAVLSYDYWQRRFGLDPGVIGRTFRTGSDVYEIVGVAQKPFTGVEPGTVTDIFIPTMMVKNRGIVRSDYQWFRTFVKLKPGVAAAPVRDRLDSVFRAFLAEGVKALPGMSKRLLDEYLKQKLLLSSAVSGLSRTQKDYDFRANDPLPGTAIVNNAFARQYFGGVNPVGKSFDVVSNEGARTIFRVIGLVADARYRNMREPMQPVAYVPFRADYARGTFIVRTSGRDPLAVAATLRQEISRARPDFHVSNIRTQTELNQSHTVRERVLAMLALFFGVVALLLAGVGLYGVLNYSVVQRRREIGIRMALGAKPADIAVRITAHIFALVLLGAAAGLALGAASARYFESLLYGVKATDAAMLALPSAAIFAAALLAALPPVIHAARIDPAVTLRAE